MIDEPREGFDTKARALIGHLSSRLRIDFIYHVNYTIRRQQFQNEIIKLLT